MDTLEDRAFMLLIACLLAAAVALPQTLPLQQPPAPAVVLHHCPAREGAERHLLRLLGAAAQGLAGVRLHAWATSATTTN